MRAVEHRFALVGDIDALGVPSDSTVRTPGGYVQFNLVDESPVGAHSIESAVHVVELRGPRKAGKVVAGVDVMRVNPPSVGWHSAISSSSRMR